MVRPNKSCAISRGLDPILLGLVDSLCTLDGSVFGRISRGRTIKQTVLGVIGWGSTGCVLFMAVCGGYALPLEMNGIIPVSDIIRESGNPAAVVAIVSTPLDHSYRGFPVLSFIFLATTLDSVAYVLAGITTKNLPVTKNPTGFID